MNRPIRREPDRHVCGLPRLLARIADDEPPIVREPGAAGDLGILAQIAQEMLLVVIDEHIFALEQHFDDHRVRLRHELDDAFRSRIDQAVHDFLQRQVTSDRQMVDHGQRNEPVGAAAFVQACALALLPALLQTGIGNAQQQRQYGSAALGASKGLLQRIDIAIEDDRQHNGD
jgi:hypothetical protein